MDIDEVLTTTRAVRKRLDFERPVPREEILDCVRVAIQAPTGSNTQGWHFVAISDPERKRALADLYRKSYEPYAALPGHKWDEEDIRAQRRDSVRSSSRYLADRYHEAPWLVIPVLEGKPPQGAMQAGYWGSLLPAFWSFMLAARARGLGTAWTTLHLAYEEAAAEVLGIPYDRVTQGGMTPVAYYQGDGFQPASRLPAESVVHWESW
ncbi:MAG: nitroreductase [Solirubrobacterales bacterium]|jgi:nitroreductase|nr:nitroreductase [Solirubrobacterales bacterium]